MGYIYVLVQTDTSIWDDIQIFTTEDSAILASIQNPDGRVEIFDKNDHGTYIPTLNYLKCGILVTPYN
jgi:hypothetical protein